MGSIMYIYVMLCLSALLPVFPTTQLSVELLEYNTLDKCIVK